ncbi:ABC transporter permease [Lentzea flaviverrucosa]|uniref:ABC-2 type transport system permease protein n=1 Tax=Lentzea flaviverrucosa TaxID=200379 RepID=A0A1H9WTY4_9PSEU|nr:ABC transporter permease [Lentzea flaviverrucosa]RDI23105.1 ABC-2 type transport system permease protein [Lentzea flaviverrucosa]SES37410.1 ABC-2 type transport system permease protein [Lentzea flaviverrucosa]
MRGFLTGVRMQLWLVRRQPDSLMTLCTIPFTTVMLLSIVIHAARPDLAAAAMIAPALIGLWTFSMSLASDVISGERWIGSLELGMSAPRELHPVFLGRIAAVMALGVIPLGETWLLGWLFFDVAPSVHHPWLFALTMVASLFAMAGTSLLIAAALLLSRNGDVFQNFLSFPIYLLSGVMVPVSYLPGFVEPLSRLVFLSWSADLMRDSMKDAPVSGEALRLLAIAVLGALALVAGRALLAATLRRAREIGTVTYA